MTGIIVHSGKMTVGGKFTSLTALETIVGGKAEEITTRVLALRNQPPPASLSSQNRQPANEKIRSEDLFDALANVKILTSQVAMHLDKEWRIKLFNQLDSLHDPDEWEQGDHPIQQSSFATFLKAILSIKPKRHPGLGLSSAGHLIGAWTNKQDRLTIEFLPNDRVRWVLARHYANETERFAGETGVSRLFEGLSNHHPEHWFLDAEKNHQPA